MYLVFDKLEKTKKEKRQAMMAEYVFESDIDEILDALDDNILFSATFSGKDVFGNLVRDPRKEWKTILENEDFIDVWREVIDGGCLERSFTATDIVFCMCPEINKSKEDLQKIYDMVGYRSHGNEQPVFFVDNTMTSSRKDGTLFTTKGIYRKNKGMIALSPHMAVKVDFSVKELYIKNTRVLSYTGTKKVFEDIVDLANIVYIFNCVRHEEGEEVYNKNIYEGVWKRDAEGNMSLDTEKLNEAIKARQAKDNQAVNDSGTGDNSKQAGCLSTVILVIIIIFIVRGCS